MTKVLSGAMDWVNNYTLSQWATYGAVAQAIFGGLTLIVATIGLIYAALQLREAARLRKAQAQPFVTVSLEPDEFIATLVIRNHGQTVARNVTFTLRPEFTSSVASMNGVVASKLWREGLPTIVPGQSFKLMIDSFLDRLSRPDLPAFYDVEVAFDNMEGKREKLKYVLDFEVFRNTAVQKDGVKEIARHLKKLQGHIDKVISGSQLSVRAYDAMHESESQLWAREAQPSTWQRYETATGRGAWGSRRVRRGRGIIGTKRQVKN